MKPYLRDVREFCLSEYPQWPAYEAGYLVTKNAGWRSQKPVIDKGKCVGCMQCYLYCPEGVIFQDEKIVNVDYDFCKGCGICKKICRAAAIEMEMETI